MPPQADLAATGISGLDGILHGGLIRGRLYLVEGVRYFEARGEVRQAISVVKKRSGQHERTIREFGMSSGKVRVGETLRNFRGVLTGVPGYEAQADPLIAVEPQT